MPLAEQTVKVRQAGIETPIARGQEVLELRFVVLVEEQARSAGAEMRVDVLRQLEQELIKDEVDLCLDFVVQEARLEVVQRAICRVVVQVQRVEDGPGRTQRREGARRAGWQLARRGRLGRQARPSAYSASSPVSVSSTCSVKIQGSDISIGNWISLLSSR